ALKRQEESDSPHTQGTIPTSIGTTVLNGTGVTIMTTTKATVKIVVARKVAAAIDRQIGISGTMSGLICASLVSSVSSSGAASTTPCTCARCSSRKSFAAAFS